MCWSGEITTLHFKENSRYNPKSSGNQMKPMYCNPSAFALVESSPLLLRLKSSIIFSTKKERRDVIISVWHTTTADMHLLHALSIRHIKENCDINWDLILMHIHFEKNCISFLSVHWNDVKEMWKGHRWQWLNRPNRDRSLVYGYMIKMHTFSRTEKKICFILK